MKYFLLLKYKWKKIHYFICNNIYNYNKTTTINPQSGEYDCPEGFYKRRIWGTNDVDWPIQYCYK